MESGQATVRARSPLGSQVTRSTVQASSTRAPVRRRIRWLAMFATHSSCWAWRSSRSVNIHSGRKLGLQMCRTSYPDRRATPWAPAQAR